MPRLALGTWVNRMAAAGTCWEDLRIVGPTFAGEQAGKTYATDLMAHKVRGSVVKGVSQRSFTLSLLFLASFNSEVEAELQCTKTGFCFVFYCFVI